MLLRSALPAARGFWIVAFALLAVMAAATVPTPLYGLYAERDGFGPLTLTLVFSAYAVGVVVALFLVGHLSDTHGRRRVLLPAIVVSAVAAALFLVWRDLAGLIVARVLSGLGVGATTATAIAWLAELHGQARPGAPSRRAEVVGVAANVGGIGAGPLVAGALAQWVGAPLTVPYLVALAALAAAFVLVARTPETREPPRPMPAYRPQRVSVPAAARPAYAGAALGAFVGFAAFGLFTSLAPSLLAGPLGHPSRALAGATAFAVFASAAAVQALLATRGRRVLVQLGATGALVGLATVVVALWLPTPSLALFLAGGVAFGAGGGALFKGSVATVVAIAAPESRAEALAGLFLVGYVGLAIPVVGLGLLSQELAPRVALLVFAVALATALLTALRPLLRERRPALAPA